jgi:hypothetical protein
LSHAEGAVLSNQSHSTNVFRLLQVEKIYGFNETNKFGNSSKSIKLNKKKHVGISQKKKKIPRHHKTMIDKQF